MIVQVGSYPPPIGGISVYIKRMKDVLDSKGIENQVWDYSNFKKTEKNILNIRFPLVPFFYAIRKDVDLIHYNICGTESKNYIGFLNRYLFKNRKKVITIHGDCMGLFDKNRKLIIKSLNSFDAIICVKSNDKEYLLKHGISSDIYEIPAFIPPIKHEEEIEEISKKIWDFIKRHKPIISANASKIAFYNSQDLYGIDMCIDIIANLKRDYPQIGLVFCLPEIKDYKYFKRINEIIVKKNIKDNILFYTSPCQFYPIVMKSDIFVRPTITDGDAVSIREALYFKIPTVASDAVSRPEGTIFFRNRNIEDFTLMVKKVLNDKNQYKKQLEELHINNNAEKIIEIYKKFMN